MKQIITCRVALSGSWGGRHVFPFAVYSNVYVNASAGLARMPVAGTIRNFRVESETAPGSGNAIGLTWEKNSLSTSLAVTIADAATTGEDLTDSVSFVADDTLTITLAETGTVPNTDLLFSFEFEGANAADSVYGIATDDGGPNSDATPDYGLAFGGRIWLANSDAIRRQYLSTAGSFLGMTARLTHAPGSGKSKTFYLVKDGVTQDGTGGTVDTSLTVANTDTTGAVSFSLPCEQFDTISGLGIATNTPDGGIAYSVSVVLAFRSTLPAGAQHLGAASNDAVASSATRYMTPLGGGQDTVFDPAATESERELIGGQTDLNLAGWVIRVPVAHGSRVVYTCRVNGVDTALRIVYAATDVGEKSVSASVTIGAGDRWSVQAVADGTVASQSTPDWTWIPASAQSAGNLLTGASHAVTGSKNVAYGESGTIAGDATAILIVREAEQ